MSAPQQDRTGQPDPTGPAGPQEFWGADELNELLADPGGAGRLGQILAAAAAPTEAEHQVGEAAARSAFRVAFPVGPARRPRVLSRISGRAATAVLAGGLVLSGGAAAAAAGALPGAAQQTAKEVLAKVGVSVPGPSEHIGGRPGRQGTSTQRPATSAAPTATPREDEQSTTGREVSGLARPSVTTGAEKGAAVSGTASDGKSHAGQAKPVSSSTGKAKTKTPTPHASKRRNGSTHKPQASGDAHTPQPKVIPHVPGSKGERP